MNWSKLWKFKAKQASKLCDDWIDIATQRYHELEALKELDRAHCKKLDIAVEALTQIVRVGYTGAEYVAREALKEIEGE